MLADVVPYLECPHCGSGVTLADAVVRCPSGHVFDVARQGYVNLLSGAGAGTGDSVPMVAARAEFLTGGHFAPIVSAVVAACGDVDGCVLDLGAGTGHYLSAVLDAKPSRVGIALEIAKPALRRAARAHPRLGAVGADTWRRLPVRTGVVAVALNVFAPRNAGEIERVLTEEGRLVVVAPTGEHLRELVSELDLLTVAPDKAARVESALTPFRVRSREVCEYEMSLRHDDVLAVVGMGPSAWHVDADAVRERVAALPSPLSVTASVRVTVFEKKGA